MIPRLIIQTGPAELPVMLKSNIVPFEELTL